MTPDDHAELYVGDDTTPADVVEFLVARTADPVRFHDGDVVVFNYHNQALDASALAEWAADADDGVYMVAYQVSAVWGFMRAALPTVIRRGDYLAYRRGSQSYVDYPNWQRTYESTDAEFDQAVEVRELLDELLATTEEVLTDV